MTAEHREEELSLATGKLRLLRAGNGPPAVVLHHSWGGAGFSPFHQALSSRFSVVSPDLPGYGGSERPEWAREPRDLAIIVQRVLDRLGLLDVTLIGLGFGGFVAAEMATMNATRLRALVLIGAAGIKPEDGFIMDQMLMGHTDYARASFRDAEHFTRIFGETPADDVRKLWDFSREMTARVSWKPFMFSRRLPPLLADVAVPALIVAGEADAVVPLECARTYAKLLPRSRLEIVPAAGHLVELEEPERIAQLIGDFVR